MAAFAAAAFAAAAMVWCCRIAIDGDALPPEAFPRKRAPKKFSKNLAEGVVVSRDGYMGVDFVKCGACRLEKRKRGALTLGALNTLVLEDLDVVLPPDGDVVNGDSANGLQTGAEDGGADVVRRLGISDAFLASRNMPFRFSAVRISNLSISRLGVSNRTERVLSARSAESAEEGLNLSDCVFSRGGAEEPLRHAKLETSGRGMRLVWKGGRADLL